MFRQRLSPACEHFENTFCTNILRLGRYVHPHYVHIKCNSGCITLLSKCTLVVYEHNCNHILRHMYVCTRVKRGLIGKLHSRATHPLRVDKSWKKGSSLCLAVAHLDINHFWLDIKKSPNMCSGNSYYLSTLFMHSKVSSRRQLWSQKCMLGDLLTVLWWHVGFIKLSYSKAPT